MARRALLLLVCVGSTFAAMSVRAEGECVVYLGGGLSEEQQLVVGAALAGRPDVLLLDTPKAGPYLKPFLDAFRPEQVIPLGTFADGASSLASRLGRAPAAHQDWQQGRPLALWDALMPRAEQVLVCPAAPRPLLLQAACLAGHLQAPLFVTHDKPDEAEELRRLLARWQTRKVFAASTAAALCKDLADIHLVPLADEAAVAAACRRQLFAKGAIPTLVVANPADDKPGLGNLSPLAPFVAARRRAALLLTNEAGDNATALLRAALATSELRQADAVILVGTPKAIPMERRVNPAIGKDTHIEMEPLTPADGEPFTLATGRLFHEDPGVLALTLARQQLLAEENRKSKIGNRTALIVSNPGGGLPLLELFSRNTVQEMRNAGYQATAYFGKEPETKDDIRRLLPEQDLFLWEGHYRTMVDEYQLPQWTEPLRPSLVFLQSCLALNEAEAPRLVQRGAVAVVGSSSRTYSGTGGAFTLCFFDGLFYDDQTLGGALRQAKNFLLCYSLLKEKRLGDDSKLRGANLRSAWAFTLWGDPTLRLPHPPPPGKALPQVRREVRGNTITLTLPEQAHSKVTTEGYQVQMLPNARLAGLLTRTDDADERRLVPFLFAEVHLPKVPAGPVPRLKSKLPERNWVFLWDSRRRCGYLLVTPRPKDEREVRFRVEWDG